MRKMFHDESLEAPFQRDGFVKVPMLSQAEVASLIAAVGQLNPEDGFAPVGRDGMEYRYHCSFLDRSLDYKRRALELIQDVFGGHIQQCLNGYTILSGNFYVKPPGTGALVIHQNWPTISNINDTTVTVWCPLGDVVAENGAVQLVPGSHKILPHVEGPVSKAYFDGFRDRLIEEYLKPNPMSAGEALIFDDGLIHWSAANESDTPRIGIQMICVPSDATQTFYFYDWQQPDRFELIEAGPEFYLSTDILDLTKRQPHWKSLGFVENRNRLIDEAEFIELLAAGPAVRAEIYKTMENPLKTLPLEPLEDTSDSATSVVAEDAGDAVVQAQPEPVVASSEASPLEVASVPSGFWTQIKASLPRLFSS